MSKFLQASEKLLVNRTYSPNLMIQLNNRMLCTQHWAEHVFAQIMKSEIFMKQNLFDLVYMKYGVAHWKIILCFQMKTQMMFKISIDFKPCFFSNSSARYLYYCERHSAQKHSELLLRISCHGKPISRP